MLEPAKGRLLVSEPFLPDPNFHRSVILIVEYDDTGTLGYVLNHKSGLKCKDLFEEFNCDETLYLGGPVGNEYLHMIHTMPDLDESVEIVPGLYRGGNFETVMFYFNENLILNHKFKFFSGYSGWSPGQLENEIEQKSWIVVDGNIEYAFLKDRNLWKQILKNEGREFSWLSNAPDDVRFN